MSDHANNAAAVTAGWQREQIDRGSAFRGNRYLTRYSKWLTGASGDSGRLLRAEGESNVDQNTADTNALNALNQQRKHYYGGAGASAGNSGKGGAHTFDVT